MNPDKTPATIAFRRRRLIGATAMTLAAAELRLIAPAKPMPAATDAAPPMSKTFLPLKQVNAAALSASYAEMGPADGRGQLSGLRPIVVGQT